MLTKISIYRIERIPKQLKNCDVGVFRDPKVRQIGLKSKIESNGIYYAIRLCMRNRAIYSLALEDRINQSVAVSVYIQIYTEGVLIWRSLCIIHSVPVFHTPDESGSSTPHRSIMYPRTRTFWTPGIYDQFGDRIPLFLPSALPVTMSFPWRAIPVRINYCHQSISKLKG